MIILQDEDFAVVASCFWLGIAKLAHCRETIFNSSGPY